MTTNVVLPTGARGPDGRFARVRDPWQPEGWDEGYVDNHGYFRVYRPDYPRAYRGNGYARRSHVVFWLMTGEVPPLDCVIHHRNEDKLDDRFENLEVKYFDRHTRDHNAERQLEAAIVCTCRGCSKLFVLPASRIRAGRGKFCSNACYRKFVREESRLRRFRIHA